MSRTVRMPRANNVKPRERQKYSSSTRGQRSVMKAGNSAPVLNCIHTGRVSSLLREEHDNHLRPVITSILSKLLDINGQFIGGLRDDQRKSLNAQPASRAIGVHVKDIHDGEQILSHGGAILSRAV